VLLHQANPQTAHGGIACYARANDSAANDQYVQGLAFGNLF
jgi:hypothetical protein